MDRVATSSFATASGASKTPYRNKQCRISGKKLEVKEIRRRVVSGNLVSWRAGRFSLDDDVKCCCASQSTAENAVSKEEEDGSGDAVESSLHSEAMALSRCGDVDGALEMLYDGLERFPENIYFLTSAGVIEGRRGNPKKAEDLFRLGVSIDPTNATTLQAWGVLEAKRGRKKKAELLFKNACKVDPSHISAYQVWGRMEADRGNIAKARELFAEADQIDPVDLHNLHAWGAVELRFGNIKAARKLLQRVLAADEKNVQAFLSLGKLEWRNNKPEVARKLFETGIDRQDDSTQRANLLNAWGTLESKRGNYGRARRLFQRALGDVPSHVHSMTAWGAMEARNGRLTKATELYSQAASLYPQNQYVKHHLAQFYRQLGKREEAERVLKELVSLNPDNSVGWHTLGQMATEVGELDQAIESFVAGKESSDGNGALLCYESLAEVYLFMGQINSAKQCFLEGAERHKKTGRFLRAWALMEKKLSNPELASKLFHASSKEDPQEARTWLKWALHERGRGNYVVAEDCYKNGLAVSASNPHLWYGYTMMCQAIKSEDEVRKTFEDALKACPRDGPLLMEFALMETSVGNIETARKLFTRGSEVEAAYIHPPLLEGWAAMEAAQGNTKFSEKLKKKYIETLGAREHLLQKQKSLSFERLERGAGKR
ncbi:hypothetical protein BSKO_04061 [Bryopsis sp. KO-2023]|nr:hypothetical protein BSKO_04061 [Bryopsis sp. KO-2023]